MLINVKTVILEKGKSKYVSLIYFHHILGIFAYLNYFEPKTRREILEYLIKGLQRLEYRGYDSAGRYRFLLTVIYF